MILKTYSYLLACGSGENKEAKTTKMSKNENLNLKSAIVVTNNSNLIQYNSNLLYNSNLIAIKFENETKHSEKNNFKE